MSNNRRKVHKQSAATVQMRIDSHKAHEKKKEPSNLVTTLIFNSPIFGGQGTYTLEE